jgi:hypothetical protein
MGGKDSICTQNCDDPTHIVALAVFVLRIAFFLTGSNQEMPERNKNLAVGGFLYKFQTNGASAKFLQPNDTPGLRRFCPDLTKKGQPQLPFFDFKT